MKAITKAGDVEPAVKERIATEIENSLPEVVNVEEIQDAVERKLMATSYKNVAKEYVRYRYKREMIRKTEETNNSILEIVAAKNVYANEENSNKNPSILSTQRDYMAGEVSKDLSDRLLLPPEIVEADRAGIIHFHDKDYFAQNMFNCCLINLEDMLQNGTVISGTMIEKPHSFATACNVATQIIAQVASNQYGGQSISLSHLAPFVDISRQRIREDLYADLADSISSDVIEEMVERRVRDEVKQGVQTIQYQVVTLMTTNGQTPFITVFMYLGEVQDKRTKDDLAMIIEETVRQRKIGVKNEKGVYITPAFPKLIYVLEEDNVTEDSKYWYLTQLCAECSAKRLVPDYISEKILMKYKYPKENLLTIKERRDRWGNESIYGPNPFKDMTEEECEILQQYVEERYESLL